MTMDTVESLIKSHYESGKRNIGQLRRAVRADLPADFHLSADKLSALCAKQLGAGIKAFGGTVDRIGKERIRYSSQETESARRLLTVTYGKGLSQVESVQSALADCKAAMQAGKAEPKFARLTLMRAVYEKPELGGLPQTAECDKLRAEAKAFLDECAVKLAAERVAREKADKAEIDRRNQAQAKRNETALAKKAAQAAQGQSALVNA